MRRITSGGRSHVIAEKSFGESGDYADDARSFEKIPGMDFQDGLRRLRGNRTLYFTLLGKLAVDVEKRLAAMRRKLAEQDFADITYHAHTIKGAAANLGATAVSEFALKLETELKQGNGADVENLLSSLEKSHAAMVECLRSLGIITDSPSP